MTTANLRIVPDDWRDATLACSVTPPTGFEVENTQNTIRSDVFRTDDTTTMTITATMPGTLTASAFFMFNHLLHGASVRVQLGSYDSGTIPVLWYTTTDDVGTFASGTKDPYKSESPFRLYFPETTYSSAQVTISGTPSAVSYFQIGRIILGRYFEVGKDPDFGLTLGFESTGRNNRTDGGSLRSYEGEAWPVLNFDLHYIREEYRAWWLNFMRRVKTSEDFAVSVFPEDGTTLERDHTINGTFHNLDPLNRQVKRLTKRFQIEGA